MKLLPRTLNSKPGKKNKQTKKVAKGDKLDVFFLFLVMLSKADWLIAVMLMADVRVFPSNSL